MLKQAYFTSPCLQGGAKRRHEEKAHESQPFYAPIKQPKSSFARPKCSYQSLLDQLYLSTHNVIRDVAIDSEKMQMADDEEIMTQDEAVNPSAQDENARFIEILKNIENRCKAASIEFVQEQDEEFGASGSILLQAGKAKRRIALWSETRAKDINAIKFENFRYLAGYEAIYSISEKSVEVALRSSRLPMLTVTQRLMGKISEEGVDQPIIEIRPREGDSVQPTIQIGPPSQELETLCRSARPRLSMKILNINDVRHDDILLTLRSYADSILFQIDNVAGITLNLERERQVRLLLPKRKSKDLELVYPEAKYNHEAMSLYWYAKSAPNFPLLQFLAYYQAIEFYFPRYSQAEARKRVSSILRRPSFRAYRDDDIDNIVSAVVSSRGQDFSSERAQLRAVIHHCTVAENLRSFLESKLRQEHFSNKGSKYHKLPIANPNIDLRNDVADRIYDIRCKIVHTKRDFGVDDVTMKLPFSEDADYLLKDIELVEYVAKEVLISSSSELK